MGGKRGGVQRWDGGLNVGGGGRAMSRKKEMGAERWGVGRE